MQGIELFANYAVDENWSVFGQFNWTDGQQNTFANAGDTFLTTESPDRLPPINGRVGARWTSDDSRFYVQGDVDLVDDQRRLSSARPA